MRYLGIDYGSKRVGIAISDEEGMMAFPFVVLQNNKRLFENIESICKEEKISSIVIGKSINNFGLPNKIMNEINKFKIILDNEIKLPIYFEKEFMTTVFARGNEGKKMNNARKIEKNKQAAADASAAALILQRYLDRNK